MHNRKFKHQSKKKHNQLQRKKGRMSSPKWVFNQPVVSPSVLERKNKVLYRNNQKLVRQKMKMKKENEQLRKELQQANKSAIRVTSKVINEFKDQKGLIPDATVTKVTSAMVTQRYFNFMNAKRMIREYNGPDSTFQKTEHLKQFTAKARDTRFRIQNLVC